MKTVSDCRFLWALTCALALALAVPIFYAGAATTSPAQVATGQKTEVSGVIVKREADTFTLRDKTGQDVVVTLTSETKVKEKKKNPFRGAQNYATTNLLRGLNVAVKGRKEASGSFFAEEIRFTEIDLRMANSLDSRVVPVEGDLKDAKSRLAQAEQNQQRLSGQVEELTAISNIAKGGAKAAQETADAALAGVNTANERIASNDKRINTRISSLDDFDVKNSMTVTFKVGSAALSKQAQEELDKLAEEAKTDKGYVIEITGYASADGPEDYNRRLSQMRADAVVRYLAENHNVPLRRIVTPFGYGEKSPVADNKTKDGREQNRRVEVKVLMNKGLLESGQPTSPTGTE
jgi:outer membrane protein OmpA-like peptidoglycan-associated protein